MDNQNGFVRANGIRSDDDFELPSSNSDLPPHSEEAERGILGCIILEPVSSLRACFSQRITAESFFLKTHQVIFAAMLDCYEGNLGDAFDVITLKESLRSSGHLEQVGGLSYVASLPDSVPSAANLETYIGIVRQKYALRKIIGACSDTIARAYDSAFSPAEIFSQLTSEADRIACALKVRDVAKRTTLTDMRAIDLTDMSETLIGNDWLERGSSCLLSAPSGIGKSVLMLQMAVMFALARPFMGITPCRPLKSVIVFAENSDRDNARAMVSVVDRLELTPKEEAQVTQNVVMRECYSASGKSFVNLARVIASEEKPDLFWLDPLAAYAGDDISKQTVIASFLREGLHPIAKDLGFAWMIINHFTKPSGDKNKARESYTASDHQYRGAGSYDLTGWTRAGIVISEHANGIFCLRLAKRGKLAGATHPSGEPTTVIWARHSASGIFWEQVDPPEEENAPITNPERKTGRKSKVDELLAMGLGPVIDELSEPTSLNDVAKRVVAYAETQNRVVGLTTAKAVVTRLVENRALRISDGFCSKN